jgi:CheY-like chemotaxis protein
VVAVTGRDPVWDVTPPAGPPLSVEMSYRSGAALLVTYATHLVKGQLSIDTTTPLPPATPLRIRLSAPGASIEVAGVVAPPSTAIDGSPPAPGMAVAITTAPEVFGDAVDRLAFEFRGVKALVAASQASPRALLGRYLRAIITCDVIEIDQAKLNEPALAQVDLTVIDLDSSGPAGYDLYARLRQHAEAGSAPVLALAQLERDRARAASLGFDEALDNPPPFAELQAATLRCLARPVSVRID